MVTDPNIILSGNRMAQPRLPDVNAMVQTRTAGMENIYAIEQQRAAQQQTAQKEQAAALVEALTPAYAIAFKGGGTKEALTAAFGVLSPEFQAAIKPQFDKIMALPSDNLRMSALETSLVGSEPGRAIHASIPTAMQKLNAEIQMGQLRVAEKNLAMEESQLGMPKPMSAAEQAQIDLDERRVRIAEEKAAREATMPEGMDAKTKVKFEQAYPKSSSALRTAVTGMDNTLAALKELIESPGLKAISGVVGAYTPDITPEATRAAALFNQIKAGAGLAALTELKQASPNGGALGNVSNQEGNTLRDSRGAFLQTQKYDDLRRALIDYYGVLERSKANIVGAFNDTYGYRGENAADEILDPMRQSQEQIDQNIQTQFPTTPQTPPPSGGFRFLNVR